MEALYDVAQWSYATLNEQRDTSFVVQYDQDRSIALNLIEAHEHAAPAGYESFALVFRGPPDTVLPQATHLFSHAAIGRSAIFITPIRHDQHGVYYEAIFNRAQ